MAIDPAAMSEAFVTASGFEPEEVYLTIAGVVETTVFIACAWQVWRLLRLWATKKIDFFAFKGKLIMLCITPLVLGYYLVVT